MYFLRSFMTLFFLSCVLITQSHALEKKNLAYQNFWHPQYHSQRLDYCTMDGKCGIYVANRYCKLMGYDYASQEIKAPNIGLTHHINSHSECKGWQCDGFMTIGCAMYLSHKPPKTYHYRKKSFVYPRLDHFRVDWCYHKNNGCGVKAANFFCSKMGYTKAISFIRETEVEATITLGDRALCFGKKCSAFKSINCYR